MEDFNPKRSIREYVNEEQLAFELMKIKYDKQFTTLEKEGKEKVKENYLEDLEKKVNKYRNKINGGELTDIGVKAYEENIKILKSDPIPNEFKVITDNFEKERIIYLDYLNKVIKDPETPKKKLDQSIKEKEYVEKVVLGSTNKENFGQILLLIIKNLGAKPSFASYTLNWKDEFFGNAIDKVMKYVYNFDRRMLSKRTGKESKAFAYITQICFNAFIAVINDRKKNEKMLKDVTLLPLEELNNVETTTQNDNQEKEENMSAEEIYQVEYDTKGADADTGKDFTDFVQFQVDYITKQNNLIVEMRQLKAELKAAYDEPDEVKATKDYISYVREIESKLQPTEFLKPVEKLKVVIPKLLPLEEQDFSNASSITDNKGLNLEIVRG
jgi:hypothetical protein